MYLTLYNGHGKFAAFTMNLVRAFSLLALSAVAITASAQSIVGGGPLTQNHAATLSGYIGRGPVTLTRIFTMPMNVDIWLDEQIFAYHKAVDGFANTVTVAHAVLPMFPSAPALIGGYKGDGVKDDFIFNLDLGTIFRQVGTSGIGAGYNTYPQMGNIFFGAFDATPHQWGPLNANFEHSPNDIFGNPWDDDVPEHVGSIRYFGFTSFDTYAVSFAPSVPGPLAALPFALMTLKRRKRA